MRRLGVVVLLSLLAGVWAQVLPAGFTTGSLKWKVTAVGPQTGARVPFGRDAVLERISVNPNYQPTWETTITTKKDGTVEDGALQNGWASTTVTALRTGAVLAHVSGCSSVWANGEPFAGDPYAHGFVRLVLPLRSGGNTLIVRCGRGSFSISMEDAKGTCSLNDGDAILPDMRAGQTIRSWGAIVVLNHTGAPLKGAELEVGDGKVFSRTRTKLQTILPYGLAKPPFELRQLRAPVGPYKLPIVLRCGKEQTRLELGTALRAPAECYTVTHLSRIDGSVQKYVVRPPQSFDKSRKYGVYLSLHGAGVDAYGQAQAHYSHFDAYVVAATNRRPFGFDWQEWGRIDALETLDDFVKHAKVDPDRVYLTGHSMGGHGTWYLGALYPSKWAAIGPCSGWISFFSYSGGRGPDLTPGPLEPLQRARLESDTLALLQNYAGLPIYALHGTADDNVPISELRTIVEKLKPIASDLHVHEVEGAGHWYDMDPKYPGADCLDPPDRAEMFARRTRPHAPSKVSFATQNPAISSEHFWLKVLQQERSGLISTVGAEIVPGSTTITVTTKNAACVAFDLSTFFAKGTEVEFAIDGGTAKAAASTELVLVKANGVWRNTLSFWQSQKSPVQNGPFKMAFDKQMVWVYGTHGTAEENAATLAKVRYDQEQWWYRGNGNIEVLADTDFDPSTRMPSNVILYGNSDTNTAFGRLLQDPAVRISSRRVIVGSEVHDGDLSAWYVEPMAKWRQLPPVGYAVGVVGATSAVATRRAFAPIYFTSGVSFPDYTVAGPDMLTKGMESVVATGYFDNEWKLEAEPQ